MVWHPDRLTRNPRELEDLLDVIEKRGLQVASVTSGDIDLSTTSGRAVARTLVAWGKHESEHKGERQRSAITAAAKRGKRHGFTPFGWRTVVPVRPPLWTDVTEGDGGPRDRGAAVGGRVVAVDRAGPERARGGDVGGAGRGRSTQVRQVALRASNAGIRTHQGVVVGNEGQWPALVSADDQERVTRLLSDPSRKKTRTGTKHLLSGVLRCGKCGGAMRFATIERAG